MAPKTKAQIKAQQVAQARRAERPQRVFRPEHLYTSFSADSFAEHAARNGIANTFAEPRVQEGDAPTAESTEETKAEDPK
jgi:hypothetical protein